MQISKNQFWEERDLNAIVKSRTSSFQIEPFAVRRNQLIRAQKRQFHSSLFNGSSITPTDCYLIWVVVVVWNMKNSKKSLHLNLPVYFDRHQGNLTACTYHTTNTAKARSLEMWVYGTQVQVKTGPKKISPQWETPDCWGNGIDAGQWGVHQYWKTSHHVVFMKNRSKEKHNFEKIAGKRGTG